MVILRKLKNLVTNALQRQFCLWVVPSGDGVVRKVRFTAGTAIILTLGSLFLTGFLLYLAGDYTRMQFVRLYEARSYFSLKSNHEDLVNEANEMSVELNSIKREKSLLQSTQSQVLGRLQELNALLESVRLPGGDTARNLLEPMKEKKEESDKINLGAFGIGGEDLHLDNYAGFPIIEEPLSDEELIEEKSKELVKDLDDTISQLRRVPIGLPGNGYVNSKFGPRRSPFSGKMRLHQGIDMALPLGSYIHSTADGEVLSVKRTRSYGLVVDIKHSSKVITRYAHLSKAFVNEGEEICRGEYIGLVGSTGHSTGPHLHYEIRVSGKAIDPLPLISIPDQVSFNPEHISTRK